MNIAKLSIKRPILISCIILSMLTFGVISLNRLGVDLYPEINFPMLSVSTVYAGAAPEEIEKLITKPLEEELGAIGGIRHIYSTNLEGISIITIEFNLDTDLQQADQNVRGKINIAKNKLPDDIDEPLVQQLDPSDTPILRMGLVADLSQSEIYDIAKEVLKPRLVRIEGVGDVKILGGTRREIQVELDQNKLNELRLSTSSVVNNMKGSGSNIPVGKREHGSTETNFRAIGEFTNLAQIEKSLISFSGDLGSGIALKDIAAVKEGNEDVKNIAYLYYPFEKGAKYKKKKGESDTERTTRYCLFLDVQKRSGANTVKVVDEVNNRLGEVNEMLKNYKGSPKLITVLDTSHWIRINVEETSRDIILGIFLAIFVVYLFLGNIRSTLITGIAIPNSLIGAFIIMYAMGFTINMITLLALSLTVGLLVDDAIVVRENIFRKLEDGLPPEEAAEKGTREVMLAVIATTLTIMSVFIPIAFLQGIIGRFFKQFGLTVVFAMAVSLFDALTVAPFLSAYFAGSGEKAKNILVTSFERLQGYLEEKYLVIMNFCLNRPLTIIITTTLIFISSLGLMAFIKQGFISEGDDGMYTVSIKLPTGTSLQGTQDVVKKIEEKIKTLKDLDYMSVTIGGDQGEPEQGKIDCFLLPVEMRKNNTEWNKQETRKFLADYKFAKPAVDRIKVSSIDDKPFILAIKGNNLDIIEEYSARLLQDVQQIADLTEVESSSEAGKPEFQIRLNQAKMKELGVIQGQAGMELRYNIAGAVVGKLTEEGLEYDIRARLKPDQRDMRYTYTSTKVPNLHNMMVPLTAIADFNSTTGKSKISRQDRAYVIAITANLAPDGAVGNAMTYVHKLIKEKYPLPNGVTYSFIGEAESFDELINGIQVAFILSIIFIFLVLASLYESFITPFTILLAIPPAMTGAILSLIITGFTLDMMSMIGMIMLMGLVTKNSILLVDFALEGVRAGVDRKQAIMNAGLKRLRPILMTTFAMMAGMLPLAMGLGEGAQIKQSMGVAILGGLIVSTIITLVVVPATFEYIDIFREFVESRFRIKPRPVHAAAEADVESDGPEVKEQHKTKSKKSAQKRSAR
ncbi:MAG TPA: efflux RND transporter permease subunit [Spirochaetota bacterium]|nr:efflux RND transporter permease subunit [Spirochaetota bacterium]